MPASDAMAIAMVAARSGERWLNPASPEMSSVSRCRKTSAMTKNPASTVKR